MPKYAKKISDKDNVITLLAACDAGEEVTVNLADGKATYQCNQETPFGHKIAIVDIAPGEPVFKYGEIIGSATQAIKTGDWVHTHNVHDDYKCMDKDGNPLPGQD
ncbi:MAG: UxaA family hydrolase [Desulfarculaceae bacterium]|jgi:altronate dehydratase